MFVNECHSTNSVLLEQASEGLLWTDYQTAGRGQSGNGWESERGKNILLSIGVKRPPIKAQEQWRMSMLFSLVVLETLEHMTGCKGLCVKWPNDIYCLDRKIAGILIEHRLDGQGIAYSVLGVGININQTKWAGNAPNPTSLKLMTGKEWNREEIVKYLWQHWQTRMPLLQDEQTLKTRYMARLYRREGMFPYVEREVSTVPTMNASVGSEGVFMATIEDVTSEGELVLRDQDGKQRTYHFKQVRYVL